MEKKSGLETFLEYMPALKIWYITILTSFYQLIVFILLMILFWWISTKSLALAVFYHLLVSFLLILFFAYITVNAEKVREKYRKKYEKLAYQKLFFRFIIYQNVFGNVSRYSPIILKTDYFLPAFIALPPSILTKTLLPIYIAIPLGVLLFIFGIFLRKPSGGFDVDIDMYIHHIFPEVSRRVEGGIYKYIRHPRYLAEFFLAFSISIFANNILALLFSCIRIIPFLVIIYIEDRELSKRFGGEFLKYKKEVPALFPKLGKWIIFSKFLFTQKD